MAISFMDREEKLCRGIVISAEERGELFVTRGSSRDGFKDSRGEMFGDGVKFSRIEFLHLVI